MDSRAVLASIQDSIRRGKDPQGTVNAALDVLRQDEHPDWKRIAEIDYNADASRLKAWYANTVVENPPAFHVSGLYFGLFSPSAEQGTDIYLGFLGQYEPTDPGCKWLWGSLKHYPQGLEAHSIPLRDMYHLAYREGGIETDAEWGVGLAYGAALVTGLVSSVRLDSLIPCAQRVGVVVSFDSGDGFKVGELVDGTFSINAADMLVQDACESIYSARLWEALRPFMLRQRPG